MDDGHGFPADVDQGKVEEMLAICNDANLIKLSLDTHSISASSDSLVLDSDLLARFHKLKSPPLAVPKASEVATASADPQEIDILGAHLASRLAALKQHSLSSSPPPPRVDTAAKPPEPPLSPSSIEKGLPSADLNPTSTPHNARSQRNELSRGVSSSEADEVEKLLASVQDQVRLTKANGERKARVSDGDVADEASDSEEEISDTEVNEMAEWAKDAARLNVSDDDEGDAEPVLDGKVRDESPRKTGKGWKFW